ncbi:uncharacterized protein LOC103521349, partial [Diaphorina citri]|uniref:Uncharacterized protein LOC103521349 n=1 Tax=Diaphorina citri TaxID=121845 RepID=A0A1S3DNV9_DIACI
MSNEKPVSCPVCQKSDRHPVYKCEKFLNMSVTNRHDCVAQKRLCFSCLSTYHSLKQCTSKGNCFKCGGKHHTLLHFERSSGVAMGRDNFSKSSTSGVGKQTPTGQVSDSGPSGVTHAMCSSSAKTNSSVLLSTVKVVSADYKGSAHELRLLLDTGSESNFLTESAVRKLGLNVTKVPSSVQGICGVSSPVKGKVDYQFKSRFDENVKFSVSALVVSKISDNLPVQPLNTECLSHLKNVLLSDNEFNVSKPVDGILGAYMFSILLESGKIVGCQNCPVAVNTLLGYTVMGGKSSDQNVENSFFCGLLNNPLENSLEFSMKKFMEIEDVPMNTVSKPEDTVCESLFRQTFKHESGKFQVSLPFKEAPEECLGESYHIAQKRFINLERKLLNSEDATLHSQYCEVMKEFLSSGYMSLVNNDISREGYYIPQHVVVRKDHASFKLRPVFDASCATSSGKSLNDILYTGPKLYNDLFNILLSFRLFPYALTTDIRKMYLQILVSEDQRKYQKVLCRFSPQEELQTYTLNTVTFGLACSPYLALRCVKELANMERDNYPLASERVQVDSYMDDICSSVSSESEACELQSQLVAMFKTGGFQLSKWASNSSTLLSRIPDEDKLESCLKWDDSSLKVLGLMWHPVTDSFSFEVNIKTTVCTKRNVLKLTASIFDVLGLIAPVTLYAKLLIKYLWQENIGWDSTPPAHIQDVWNVFQQELSLLSNMSFNRHIDVYLDSDVTLVGFGDASEKAYACAIYSVVKSTNKTDSHSLAQFQYKVSNIDNICREISELVDQVNDLKSQEDPDYDPDYSDLQRSIDLTSKIKFYQSKLANVSSDVDSEVEPKARVKLPPLELPSFNGDVNRFPVFYYAFKSMIHDNRELSDEQRIQYLIGKLSDKALSVVSGVPAIGQNYNIIWNNLVDKYLDSRVLVSSYFDQILNLKSVKCDSITHLNNFVDKFTSMVECLRALDIENLGDVLLCHIGASKLDPELRKQFEISVKGEDEPGVDLLLSFLREQ